MKVRTAALASIAIALIVGACGGGTSLEAYLEGFEVLNQDVAEDVAASRLTFNLEYQDAENEEERLALILSNFDSILVSNEDHVAGVRRLSPTQEVQQAHDAWVEGVDETLDFLATQRDALKQITSTEEAGEFLVNLLEYPESLRLSGTVDDACFALQAVADGEGIDVDLLCAETLG